MRSFLSVFIFLELESILTNLGRNLIPTKPKKSRSNITATNINTAARISCFSSNLCNLLRYILLELYIISPKPATSKAKADTAYVAQLVEQRYRKPQVVSSNLTVGSYGN